jgi:EAL domain-containing protein (putative c-di-GMP-specific phosphodiesterase class I)
VPVAVNLSMRNLHDPELPATIARLLDTWEVPAELLVIEITESTLMAEPTRAMETLTLLRTMGVRISIDDFGTGYSSLAYLKRLPVDELKIDKSFVDQMATDRNDVAIVRSTIGLGHELGLKVTAEGVEDRATWDLLASLGCDTAQGFYVSRPMPAAELTRWLSCASSALGHAAQGQGVDVDAETLERSEYLASLASDLGLKLSTRAA